MCNPFITYRFAVNAESSGVSRVESVSLTNDQFPDIHHKAVMKASEQTVKPDNSVNDEKTEIGMDQCSTHSGRDVAGGTPNVPSYKTKHNVEDGPHLVSQTRGQFLGPARLSILDFGLLTILPFLFSCLFFGCYRSRICACSF